MMNQGGSENEQVVDASQGNLSLYSSFNSEQHSWASSTGQVSVTWNSYGTNDGMIKSGHGHSSSSGYQYDAHKEMPVSRDAQGGLNGASQASISSSLSSANAAQNYYNCASYSNSNDPASYPNSNDPNGYSTMGYQGYYYGYQQPSNDSSAHHVGVNQNSGVPYQPLSSFQNSASSIGPSYSVTYYNAGDHQTMAAYQNGSYNNPTNVWNDGNSGSYPFHHYTTYTSPETSSAQINATTPANTQYYQHHYSQWPGYYSHTAATVSCAPAPGTESAPVTTANAVGGPMQGVSGGPGGYPYSNNQPPPPGTTFWRRDSVSSSLPSLQGKNDATGYNANADTGYPVSQNNYTNQLPSYFRKPFDSSSLPHNSEDQQKTIYSQGPSLPLSSTNQVPEKFQPPLQMLPAVENRVVKIQIPTNPRITSTLPLVMPKVNKESTVNDAAAKPAYISVSVPKPSDKLSAHGDSEAIIKGTLPASLRAYVERSFAHCKDDAQRAASQNIMKEIITKASTDGTLFTRNWDIEPLFPLPNTTAESDNLSTITSAGSISSLPKRSPSRRAKSRWEPIPDEKLVEKPSSTNHELANDVRFSHLMETERVAYDKKYETVENGWNGVKFPLSQQFSSNKISHRPVKKQRFGDTSNLAERVDASNDADERSLTKYYSSAIALATPEEKKRREHRSKRFEKGQEQQAEIKSYSSKSTAAGNLYSRKANVLLLSKTYDNGSSRAVEDIDWDALTVKGTCQEVEKRYLRLTSAPDPATVRPEDVLVKALQMVQTSEKNYLYKCDQLKSIRQDLTVQRIQNELTVKVYETHARLALEAGDLPEYNQCQSQLKSLYAEGITGSDMEFSAYNLLCVILHSNNKRDVLSLMIRLSSQAKDDEAVKHALAVRRAVSSGNYVLFFRLYKEATNLSACLMDLYVEKMRFEAVKCISRSYRPTVPVSYLAQVLGFSRKAAEVEGDGKGIDGLKESEEWLRAHGACLTVDGNGELQMDTKATSSGLYMPEPEDAVAHGDANLAVDDFLTRASS